ncbi:hypothetical protein AMTR_s00038p00027700 [Amborella trichopoda]|uniref:Uncharacterized protein n=1 Tax=Amborella trichopoda TaxID=13333 RepID=U5D2C0_AMBTC|nr:hypothetical protein AMTR_s00038p00027700 [Amborella trichopoda]
MLGLPLKRQLKPPPDMFSGEVFRRKATSRRDEFHGERRVGVGPAERGEGAEFMGRCDVM